MESKVFSVAELNSVLSQTFRTKRLINSPDCVGYIVKLDRPMLPVTSADTTVSGGDLMAMLSKLNEWERTIEEVRTGILHIIESQLQVPK